MDTPPEETVTIPPEPGCARENFVPDVARGSPTSIYDMPVRITSHVQPGTCVRVGNELFFHSREDLVRVIEELNAGRWRPEHGVSSVPAAPPAPPG